MKVDDLPISSCVKNVVSVTEGIQNEEISVKKLGKGILNPCGSIGVNVKSIITDTQPHPKSHASKFISQSSTRENGL